jgi:hypothetical protein
MVCCSDTAPWCDTDACRTALQSSWLRNLLPGGDEADCPEVARSDAREAADGTPSLERRGGVEGVGDCYQVEIGGHEVVGHWRGMCKSRYIDISEPWNARVPDLMLSLLRWEVRGSGRGSALAQSGHAHGSDVT